MSRVILALLLFVAVASAFPNRNPPEPRECPENEQFNTCGSACEPACGRPKSDICTLQCIIGCQCKEGFLRNSAGKCVPPPRC